MPEVATACEPLQLRLQCDDVNLLDLPASLRQAILELGMDITQQSRLELTLLACGEVNRDRLLRSRIGMCLEPLPAGRHPGVLEGRRA